MKRRFPIVGLALLLVGLAGIGLFRFYTVRYYRPLGSASGLGRDGNYGWPMTPGLGRRGWGVAGEADIGVDAAKKAATDFVASLGPTDLAVTELWKFTNTPYYAPVIEKSTGRGAFEVLVDRATGRVYPEMGPNMMWNAKYGTAWGYGMRSMMGSATGAGGAGPGANDGTKLTVTEADARARADSFVKANASGLTLGPRALTFYGYYNFTVQSGGKPHGIISVNGYSGQVWYHAWHGAAEQVTPIS
ncbi:MAG: hypothetical protein ACYC9Q_10480 [Bacillota bacterium]